MEFHTATVAKSVKDPDFSYEMLEKFPGGISDPIPRQFLYGMVCANQPNCVQVFKCVSYVDNCYYFFSFYHVSHE